VGKDAFLRVAGRPIHHVPLGGLHGQRKGREAVRDEIHPEDLDRLQGKRQPQERGQEERQDLAGITGQQVFDELPDVVVDHPALLDGAHDRGKIVVQEDHVAGLLGDVRAHDAHGDADVGALQGGGVVDPVARHRHALPPVLQGLDDLELLLGDHPGVDPDVLHPLLKDLRGRAVQVPAGHHRPPVLDDPDAPGDGERRQRVIARDHDGPDPGGFAEGDGPADLLAGRVHHAHEAQEGEALFDLPRGKAVGHAVPEPGGHTQDAQAIARHPFVRSRDQGGVERRRAASRKRVDGLFEHDVDAALREGHVPPGPPVKRRHALALRVEGDFGYTGVLLLEIALDVSVLQGRTEKGNFRRIPRDPDDILVDIGKRIVAERQRLHQVVEPFDLGLTAVEQLPVGPDLLDGHPVQGECPGLVGTDIGDRPQGLHGRELADKGIMVRHLARSQCKRDGDDGGQRLGDGGDGKRNGRQEHQHGFLPAQEPHAENEGADEENRHGHLPAEDGEALLEGCLDFLLFLEQGGDLPQFRVHPRSDDHAGAPAVGHDGALEDHVRAVSQGKHLLVQCPGVLIHGNRLAREGRLLDFEDSRFREPHVRRDNDPRVQQHQVPGDNLRAGDGSDLSVAKDPHDGGGHLLEGLHGLFGTVLLGHADGGVQQDDEQNGDGVGRFAEQTRNHGRRDQDEDHEIPELIDKHGRERAFALFHQLVGAEFCKSIAGFFRTKAVDGNIQLGEDRLDLLLVPDHNDP